MAETRVYTNNQLADNREPGKKKKLQTEKERSSRRNKPQETSSQSFDIEVVSNKYERMSQKEETNLVVVVSELYIGTRELGLDDAPEPVVIAEPYVISDESVGPVPPVRRATNLPWASAMMEPESPALQNGPESL